ncbi:MAG: phosphatidic acid phosphatase [Oscillospiraceae bacterium]|nr:phosphatidic acid phosphatase [Oscillospiraceae bacterium]
MKLPAPAVDYRLLRLHNINSPAFRHVKLLLFWPIFGWLFYYAEQLRDVENYTPIYCPLDDCIPFLEIFVLPYLWWFVFLAGIHIYTFFYDVENFKKLMRFIIISYGLATIIYYVFPNCQELRPVTFPRDNLLTRFMAAFYAFDTSTNVCPSLHVIGSLAVMGTAWQCPCFRQARWKIGFFITAMLISVSTVFLKQHSVLDILAAVPVCMIAWYFSFSPAKQTAVVT